MTKFLFYCVLFFFPVLGFTQTLLDDFEGNGIITTWFGDDCNMNTSAVNPFLQGENTSETVLEYGDVGGQYANVRFEVEENFDLLTDYVFSLKIYVPSTGITGNSPNQLTDCTRKRP